ncbi:MAG: PspC domain-containing protein [Bacteroidales bacterium]|nr:PspC domain-containing protein [Bacteroidales bacterium]MCF8334195.1 PspC domain-containing protein [Bacteroidales bacterium]
MKKSFNININGIIFHIDEDAYEKLNAYLNRLKNHFAWQEGGSEVVNDIEARIAEILRERINEEKQVITIEDIDEVIRTLGEPSEMQDEQEQEQEEAPPRYGFDQPKRLYRDPDNKIIGGVGGGMGAYFNTDPIWFRLLFVLSFFVVGPLAYIIFWIAIPMARTTTEKLEMRGKKVNISNIERSVKDEFKDIGDNFQKYTSKAKQNFDRNKDQYRDTTDTVLHGLSQILLFAVKVLAVVAGLVLILTGLSFATGLLAFIFVPDIPVMVTHGIPIHFSMPVFLDMVFSGGLDSTLIILGLVIVIGLPLAGLIILGLRLIFGPRIKTHYFGPTALIVWFAAVLITGISIAFTVNDFRFEENVKDEISLNKPTHANPYIFKIDHADNLSGYHDINKYIFYKRKANNSSLRNDFRGMPEFGFYVSEDSTAYVVIKSESQGASPMEAKKLASRISYGFRQNENKVLFEPWFYIPEGEKFRLQDVYIKVYLPEGTRFRVDTHIEEMAYPWYIDDDDEYIVKEGEIEEISAD